jgi:hypothetical protein
MKKSEVATSILVDNGKSSDHSNISSNFGTTNTIITKTTHKTTHITKSGYIIADFIFQDIDVTFSI